MQIQWYPGHMTKARRAMKEDMKLVDLVVELTDARNVSAGRNPDIGELAGGKARLILLNKADLADERVTSEWIACYRKEGIRAAAINAKHPGFKKQFLQEAQNACSAILEKDRQRGLKKRVIRAMVAGIPNVGKSTLINTLAGRAAAKTGNKPGVTRGNQWIRVDDRLELLDTPGILWPKFEDRLTGLHLAMTGSVSDDILNITEVTLELMSFLLIHYPDALTARYGISRENDPERLLIEISGKRGCLKRGGEPDYEKAAGIILDDFRSGRLGRISLERPMDIREAQDENCR